MSDTKNTTSNYRAQKARNAAIVRLIEMHKADFDRIHREEKTKHGVQDRAAAREQRERELLATLAAKYGAPDTPPTTGGKAALKTVANG